MIKVLFNELHLDMSTGKPVQPGQGIHRSRNLRPLFLLHLAP